MNFSVTNVAVHLLLGALVACQEARPTKVSSPSARVDSSATANSSGGDGNDGGAAGSDGAGDSQGGSSATGSVGAIGAGATDGGDIVSACAGNRAFAVVSGVFVDPTPAELATRLSDTSYEVSPISFVLFSEGASADSELAASYTVAGSGAQAWPASREPEPSVAWLEERGFGSVTAQEDGWMLVNDASAPIEVRLRNVRVTASTETECDRGTATLVAVVPAEWTEVLNEIAPGTAPEAASDRGAAATDVTISAEFAFEQVEFEFGAAR